jgi:hypothetical protein
MRGENGSRLSNWTLDQRFGSGEPVWLQRLIHIGGATNNVGGTITIAPCASAALMSSVRTEACFASTSFNATCSTWRRGRSSPKRVPSNIDRGSNSAPLGIGRTTNSLFFDTNMPTAPQRNSKALHRISVSCNGCQNSTEHDSIDSRIGREIKRRLHLGAAQPFGVVIEMRNGKATTTSSEDCGVCGLAVRGNARVDPGRVLFHIGIADEECARGDCRIFPIKPKRVAVKAGKTGGRISPFVHRVDDAR